MLAAWGMGRFQELLEVSSEKIAAAGLCKASHLVLFYLGELGEEELRNSFQRLFGN